MVQLGSAFIGERTYANFNLTILDTCPVKIGKDVFIGPNVSILTPMHPLRWQERNAYHREDGVLTDKEYGKPITIGDNVWLAGNVPVLKSARIKTAGLPAVVFLCGFGKAHFLLELIKRAFFKRPGASTGWL